MSSTWGQVDAGGCCIHLLKAKHGERSAPMPTEVQVTLELRCTKAADDRPDVVVFPTRSGGPVRQMSDTYNRSRGLLGLSEGLADRRQRTCFHTLRHNYASWLVMSGTPLYAAAKLLGHSMLAMTERYAYLAPDHVHEAVANLEDFGGVAPGCQNRIRVKRESGHPQSVCGGHWEQTDDGFPGRTVMPVSALRSAP